MEVMKDGSHLYEVERRAEHAARPGFRITELQISPTQKVPWHFHSNVQDTFYVINGQLRLFLREPKEEVRLGPGDTYSVKPRRPHLVTNGGDDSVTFPCAMPEFPVDPRHSRDEAVRLDRAQDRARLGVDLVDLPVAVLPDPERALCPRHARVVTLAGRRKGGDDRSRRGVDFLNAI